jgi:hypothetical protein
VGRCRYRHQPQQERNREKAFFNIVELHRCAVFSTDLEIEFCKLGHNNRKPTIPAKDAAYPAVQGLGSGARSARKERIK